MPKPDAAHRATDDELAKLERRIARLYREAADDLQETIEDYFEKYKKRDEEMKALIGTVQNGKEWTEQDYKLWRLNQIGRGRRYEALREKIAQRMTNAHETAIAYVNDATPGIYSLNRNYAAYTIERVAGNVDFTIWDEQTVRRLIVEQPDLMPYYPKAAAVRRGIDLEYGKKQITKCVTSSVLQGKSIKGISDDLQRYIPTMSRDSAIRAARTAVTGAQNAGRMDSYAAAAERGISLKREWVATLDNRTRHAHAMLDGTKAGMNEPFKVDGYKIMFPGDRSAPGYLVYNCFVGETQIASDSKIVRSYKHTYKGDLIEVKTACGINFTCTPNHPILTPYGWVAAALLHNGDNLVVTFDRNTGSFRRNSNIKHIHSRMKALYNSLHCFGLMIRDSTLRINFHGDIPTTNVEVITKKWLLRDSGNSGVRQSINKFLLKNTNKSFMSQCPFMKHFGSVCKAALRFISSKCQTLALLWRSLFHPNIHGFRTVSGRDVGVTQDTINNLTAKSETLGKVLDGFSGEIAVDKVVSVKIIPSGQTATHVYNLQTQNGYYFVNSSIPQSGTKCNGVFAIAKNCRCTMVAAVDGIDTSDAMRRAHDPETGESVLIKNMTYREWTEWKKSENSTTWDTYIKKGRNASADKRQLAEYRSALGNIVSNNLDAFQKMKYNEPEKWAEVKERYRYKKRVPEATKKDFENYRKVKATGVVGTIRVPPEPINIEQLAFADAHGMRHGCTLDDAKHYAKTAKCTVRRHRWDGVSINCYALDGATYLNAETLEIKTAFSKNDFDPTIQAIAEVFK